jgi:hypothetical protein
MGILPSNIKPKLAPGSTKRRSAQMDFSNLPPLKSGGTVGFSSFRDNDQSESRRKARKRSTGSIGGAMAEDSEEEDDEAEIVGKMEDIDDRGPSSSLLSPEDAQYSGELAEGVGRIKVSGSYIYIHEESNSRL